MQDASNQDRDPIPQVYALTGPLLLLCAFLPLMPNGSSFWRWSIDLCSEFGWTALAWILGASTPFLLGLVMCVASVGAYLIKPRLCQLAQQGIVAVVSMLISHAIVFSAQLWWRDIGVASGEFLLVSLGSGIALAVSQGKSRAASAPADSSAWAGFDTRAFSRWACLVIAAASAWARLQMIGGVTFGWAIEVLLLASALTVWALAAPSSPASTQSE